MNDLVQWLRAQLDEDERIALALNPDPVASMARKFEADALHLRDELKQGKSDRVQYDEGQADALHWASAVLPERIPPLSPLGQARILREIDAKRRLLALHTPEWAIVEWAHDQSGKGEAQVCRSCGNRDIDSWLNWRRLGDGDLPEGVKPPYIVAPCQVLRLLALPYADRPDYREEWRP